MVLKSADQGHVDAQFRLGVLYYNGDGVAKDYEEAMKWYLKAAERHAVAQDRIGDLYYYGHGVVQDYKEAMKWYLEAADQGHAAAQRMYGSSLL